MLCLPGQLLMQSCQLGAKLPNCLRLPIGLYLKSAQPRFHRDPTVLDGRAALTPAGRLFQVGSERGLQTCDLTCLIVEPLVASAQLDLVRYLVLQ